MNSFLHGMIDEYGMPIASSNKILLIFIQIFNDPGKKLMRGFVVKEGTCKNWHQ